MPPHGFTNKRNHPALFTDVQLSPNSTRKTRKSYPNVSMVSWAFKNAAAKDKSMN